MNSGEATTARRGPFKGEFGSSLTPFFPPDCSFIGSSGYNPSRKRLDEWGRQIGEQSRLEFGEHRRRSVGLSAISHVARPDRPDPVLRDTPKSPRAHSDGTERSRCAFARAFRQTCSRLRSAPRRPRPIRRSVVLKSGRSGQRQAGNRCTWRSATSCFSSILFSVACRIFASAYPILASARLTRSGGSL